MDNDYLQDIFNFNVKDLQANREGLFSERQRKIFRRRFLLYRFVLVAIAVEIISIFVFIIRPQFRTFSLKDYFITTACFGILALVWFLYLWYSRGVRDEFALGDVDTVQGSLYLHHQSTGLRGRGTQYYYIGIGDVRFSISYKQYNQIAELEEGIYTIYYSPKTRNILSMERL